jgi:hypothetical protein
VEASPKTAMNPPQAAAASTIARPLWCTLLAQPLVAIEISAPTPGAAHSSPTTCVPP